QVGAASAGQAKEYDSSGYDTVTYATLFNYLRPSSTFFYMQEIPELDGWGHAYEFGLNPDTASPTVMILASRGRGGEYDDSNQITGTWSVGPFVATDYDRDIAWADGYFVAWPE
ncbi:MAG: hypothetical protein AAFX50_07805, partial [Acidobacteriota bacterium]